MMDRDITIRIKVSRRMFVWGAAVLMLCCSANELVSESMTMTTYYPAPSGVYKRISTTGKTVLATQGSNVGIGTITPNPSASLDVTSTVAGLLPPRMTTAQRDMISPAVAGLMIYNTTANEMEYYNGTSWVQAFRQTIWLPMSDSVVADSGAALATNGSYAYYWWPAKQWGQSGYVNSVTDAGDMLCQAKGYSGATGRCRTKYQFYAASGRPYDAIEMTGHVSSGMWANWWFPLITCEWSWDAYYMDSTGAIECYH